MDCDDLKCNIGKCRKRIESYAWVTSCSHIFCNEDGIRVFETERNLCCPACKSSLTDKFDIIKVDINPSEQFKSMVLSGYRPEVIIDICGRALSFWSYQVNHETLYQSHSCSKLKERVTQLENAYEQVINKIQTEFSSLKIQLAESKKTIQEYKQRTAEMSNKLMEKNKEHQKLKTMYEGLRRKMMNPPTVIPDLQIPTDHILSEDARRGMFPNTSVIKTLRDVIAEDQFEAGEPAKKHGLFHRTGRPTPPINTSFSQFSPKQTREFSLNQHVRDCLHQNSSARRIHLLARPVTGSAQRRSSQPTS